MPSVPIQKSQMSVDVGGFERGVPEPILMRPLCWMKMVSQVRLPWMMGGSQECR